MIINIIGWAFLIASWVLPKKIFKEQAQITKWKLILSSLAVFVFVTGWLNYLFNWW